jgi:ABC-type antimicrobial peptide transport system permease subunit
MRATRGLRLSVRAIGSNPARAVLVLATIAVGIGSTVAAGALGAGAEGQVMQSLATLGTNLIVVRPAQVPRLVSRREVAGRVTTLVPADAREIAQLPAVAAAAPGIDGAARAKVGRIAVVASIMGTTPAFRTVRGYRVSAGRFLEDADDVDARRVAVLGARLAAALFPEGDAVGRELRLRGVPFEVIGTLAPKGAAADGGDEDGLLVLPIATAMRRVFNRSSISAVFVSATDVEAMDGTSDAIGRVMRLRHRPGRDGRDDFDVQNTARQAGRRQQTLAVLDGVTNGLGAVTMLAGGIGVFTLMWLSVADRTAEIGLRLAVGATRTGILGQFLAEALLLTIAGWVAGLAAGGLAIGLLAGATRWPIGLPLDAILASTALSLTTALVAGSVPAVRAARIAPVEALRGA